jgi:hypothetical protein
MADILSQEPGIMYQTHPPRVGSRGELGFDEFKIIRDGVKFAPRLIDLTQRERAFVWHTHSMPANGFAIVKSATAL